MAWFAAIQARADPIAFCGPQASGAPTRMAEQNRCIWKRVAGRTLTPEVARQLMEEGKTREVLSGFRSRAGKPFRARLVLNDEGKIEFDFPARARDKEPAAAE